MRRLLTFTLGPLLLASAQFILEGDYHKHTADVDVAQAGASDVGFVFCRGRGQTVLLPDPANPETALRSKG